MIKKTVLSALAPFSVFALLSLPLSRAEEPLIKDVKFPPEFLSLSHSQPNASGVRVSGVLDALMTFHPGWITRSVSGRGTDAGGPADRNGYRTLFHAKGEGRITRIRLSAEDAGELSDYKELWIETDGHTVYKGSPADLFEGRGKWKFPLVAAYGSGGRSFDSFVPFSYSREARVLFKGRPHRFGITYRQGPGSSYGPGYGDVTEFLAEQWVERSPAANGRVTVQPGKPASIAKGPLTIAALSLRVRPESAARLRVRVGGQDAVPALFFFGLGDSSETPLKGQVSFRSAVNHVDAAKGLMMTRLPVPLQEGEELYLEAGEGAPVDVSYGLASAAARPGVRLLTQYRDQGAEAGKGVNFFETSSASQLVSLVEESSGGGRTERSVLAEYDGIYQPLQAENGEAAVPEGASLSPFYGRPAAAVRDYPSFRHFLLDPVAGRSSLRFGLEPAGKGKDAQARYRTLALAYVFDSFRLVSRSSAEPKNETVLNCPASFASRAGSASAGGRGVLLVRGYDASTGPQEAALRLNGRAVGGIFEAASGRGPASDALWTELRSSDCADGTLRLAAEPSGTAWNASRYEALFFDTDGSEDAPMALKQGSNIRICDAGIPGGPFYINDHTIVRGPDGRWHLMGIFHHELADPLNEVDFVHARARSSDPSDWSGEDFVIGKGTAGVALSVDRALGETHLWAPHAVRNGDEYVMVFHAGGPEDDSQIKLARSSDLENWRRSPQKPLFTDICTARDPMLLRAGDLWVMYYTRCDGLKTQINGVAYRTSADLENWSEPAMAMTLPGAKPLPNSGYTESPFVFERGGWYYLSVTSYPVEYDSSFLYRSRSPFNFGDVPVARFKSHAPEWVEGGDEPGRGPMFITHAGWGQGGVWLAPVTGW